VSRVHVHHVAYLAHRKNHCAWYFHRSGNKTYKSGTYKGLDLAIGNEKVFGGILIRSLECADTGQVIEGSCLCVNAILKAAGVDSVPELADTHIGAHNLGAASDSDTHPLRLVLSAKPRHKPLERSMRVGLTLKQSTNAAARLQFIGSQVSARCLMN
jgi:hypothetical protein